MVIMVSLIIKEPIVLMDIINHIKCIVTNLNTHHTSLDILPMALIDPSSTSLITNLMDTDINPSNIDSMRNNRAFTLYRDMVINS